MPACSIYLFFNVTNYIVPTHAVITFDDEDSRAVIPVKKIQLTDAEPVKVGSHYCVKWTDSKIYQATVYALGTVIVQSVEQVIHVYKHGCSRCLKRIF